MSLTLLLAAQEAEHVVKPLDGRSLALTIGVIVLVMGLVMLAGFGYFSPSDKDGD